MRTKSSRLVLSVLGLATLVSCSSTSEGSPKPAPTNDTRIETSDSAPPPPSDTADPGGVDLPYAGAPKVDDPLDTAKFQQKPCLALTAAQTQELNVSTQGEQREGPLGMICTFKSKSDRTAYAEFSFFDKYPHGLSAMYKSRNDGEWDFFAELTPIEGFPAVSWARIDERDTGRCNVAVGVADDLAFDIGLGLSQANVGKKDPCEMAAMVAGMALQTMKAGQ